MIDTTTNTVIDAVRHLAAYTASADILDIAAARRCITNLYNTDVEIALPLWTVALHIQRALSLNEEDGE